MLEGVLVSKKDNNTKFNHMLFHASMPKLSTASTLFFLLVAALDALCFSNPCFSTIPTSLSRSNGDRLSKSFRSSKAMLWRFACLANASASAHANPKCPLAFAFELLNCCKTSLHSSALAFKVQVTCLSLLFWPRRFGCR